MNLADEGLLGPEEIQRVMKFLFDVDIKQITSELKKFQMKNPGTSPKIWLPQIKGGVSFRGCPLAVGETDKIEITVNL